MFHVAPTKRKITAYLDPEIARAAKIRAARTDRRDSEVIEDALRKYLGMAALDDSQILSTLSEGEAMDLANAELHLMRAERAQRSD